jgi:cytochrome c oxidase subunit 2
MESWRMMRTLRLAGSGTLAGLLALLTTASAFAGAGQPSPWQVGLQEPVTDVAESIVWFHNSLVNVVITAIAVFVLVLMAIIVFRFNERANPAPSRTTHNTVLEVLWTVIPVLILVVIAIPSFKLLYFQYAFPKPDLTIKATGSQWNWTHAYPDQGNFSFTSVMLNDAERAERIKRGLDAPRLLAVDNEVVIPVDKIVHVLVTANDVIHNWTIPSFGSKVDAVPGRITATWFHAKKEGVYYGQCSELCGKDHAFMPIAVRVVKEAVFKDWAEAMKARDRKKAREVIEKAALEQDAAKVVALQKTPAGLKAAAR